MAWARTQEGAAQGARRRGGRRPQAVPAGGAAGAQAARARHAPAGGAAARPGLQRVARVAHAGAVRAREPAVRRRVGVLLGARARLRRHVGPGRPQLRVVRRARQEVARGGAAVRGLRHDLHAEDRQRRDHFPHKIRERVPGRLRRRGAARGAPAVPRGGAPVRRALPRAGPAAPARAPAPHLRAPHGARPPLRAARPQGDRGAARPGGGAAAGRAGGRGGRRRRVAAPLARRHAAAVVGVTAAAPPPRRALGT
ncbi:translation initiation factor IF-2 isoform X4 [Pararge aegeria]|uniref:translation initiation factor IF-2 isoform X4 n=1 Tax=Pararge aegeria TaxID=116150 RepID=UPI0019D31D01|nr:translation initiation factor IF-2 isoform X4 [Pararge aegeria]